MQSGAPPSGPSVSPGFHLWHASLRWRSAVGEALRALELTPTQFFVLGSTAWLTRERGEAPKQAEVAAHAGLDPMTTSQVLRALEKAGHVRREKDAKDSRAVRVAPTASGGELVKAGARLVRSVDEQFFSSLGSEAPAFLAALRALCEAQRASPEVHDG